MEWEAKKGVAIDGNSFAQIMAGDSFGIIAEVKKSIAFCRRYCGEL
jgi:hypothetical protein